MRLTYVDAVRQLADKTGCGYGGQDDGKIMSPPTATTHDGAGLASFARFRPPSSAGRVVCAAAVYSAGGKKKNKNKQYNTVRLLFFFYFWLDYDSVMVLFHHYDSAKPCIN